MSNPSPFRFWIFRLVSVLVVDREVRNLPSAGCTIRFLLLLCAISSCNSQNHSLCQPSSCGKIREISYPFRLKTEPRKCGKPDFELDCQNNRTITNFGSKKYYVQAISYDNYTIRLVDPSLEPDNICSFPNYTIDYNDLPSNYYTFKPGKVVNEFIDLNKIIVFVNCKAPVNSPRYINTTFCSNRGNTFASNSSKIYYSYVIPGDEITASEFDESCSVDKVAWSSVRGPIAADNTSLSGVHAGLEYGFELSWFHVLCEACEASRSTCIVLETTVTCRHYCYEDTPLEERSFGCKMEYYAPYIMFYGGIGIAGILGVRFICGLCCLVGLVSHQWKRRHLSMDDGDDNEDFLHSQR